MVYASLKQTILALNSAETALESTVEDIQDRIKEPYVEHMTAAEIRKALGAFERIESILKQLDKTKSEFRKARGNFKKATSH